MTKFQIIDDIKFRQACYNYGLNYQNIEVYDDVILVSTPIENLYVLFDKNYNTIGVEKTEYLSFNNKAFVAEIYERYSSYTDILPFGDTFGFPFQKYTLKDFIELSNRIDVIETNTGHPLSTRINGEWFDRNSKENTEYFELLSYVKFIGERIKQYFLMNYHMQVMGFEIIDIYSYIRGLIDNINNYVRYSINIGRRPCPSDIISRLGLNNIKLNCGSTLYDISNLLMRENGVKVKNEESDVLELLSTSSVKKDLSILSFDLLKLLNISDEELNLKEKNNSEEFVNKQIESLLPWLEEDIEDDLEKGPVLTNKK